MAERNQSTDNGLKLFIYWLIVGIPLAWGIWNTLLKLPALFKRSSPNHRCRLAIAMAN